MSLSYPPGLPPPEPGWYYMRKGAGWSLEQSENDTEGALARIEHRQAYRRHEERETAARQQDAKVSELAEAALRAVPSDKELGVVCADLSPARGQLVRCVAWIELGKRRLSDAEARAGKHRELEAKRDTVAQQLRTLEESVREEFARYNEYASAMTDKPDSRDAERQRLAGQLSSAEWQVELSQESDGLVVHVAQKVLDTLSDRLVGLRVAVLKESAQPAIDHVRALVEELKEAIEPLCGLAEGIDVGSSRSEGTIRVSMPIGPAIEVSAYWKHDDVEAWKSRMDALAADPLASIGDRPKSPTGPKKRALGWIRS
jgi:hypothetical protein